MAMVEAPAGRREPEGPDIYTYRSAGRSWGSCAIFVMMVNMVDIDLQKIKPTIIQNTKFKYQINI